MFMRDGIIVRICPYLKLKIAEDIKTLDARKIHILFLLVYLQQKVIDTNAQTLWIYISSHMILCEEW